MTPEQSESLRQAQDECTELLKLGPDGVWFCPKCGLKLSLPLKPPWPGSGRAERAHGPDPKAVDAMLQREHQGRSI